MIHNKLMVSRFADENQIHPCIIYSQFQWRQAKIGNDYWAAFREEFPNIALATKNLNIANWDVDSIKETATKMRNLLTV